MGNRVEIVLTKFMDMDIKGEELDATYGLRVFDDNDQAYVTGLKKEEILGRPPHELVELARGIDDRARDMIAFAEESLEGIYVGDRFFTWNALKGDLPAPGSNGP